MCPLVEFNIIFTGTGDWTIFGTHFFSILKHSTLLPIKYTNYSKTLKVSQTPRTHALYQVFLYILYKKFSYHIIYIFIITIHQTGVMECYHRKYYVKLYFIHTHILIIYLK